DRRQDDDPAHGRGALLGAMPLGRVLADRLAPVLQLSQAPDEPRADDQRDDERRDQGHERTEAQVAKDVEDDVVLRERDEEVIEHPSFSFQRARRATSASTTRSMRMPREPLTSTTSPGATPLR